MRMGFGDCLEPYIMLSRVRNALSHENVLECLKLGAHCLHVDDDLYLGNTCENESDKCRTTRFLSPRLWT